MSISGQINTDDVKYKHTEMRCGKNIYSGCFKFKIVYVCSFIYLFIYLFIRVCILTIIKHIQQQ